MSPRSKPTRSEFRVLLELCDSASAHPRDLAFVSEGRWVHEQFILRTGRAVDERTMWNWLIAVCDVTAG